MLIFEQRRFVANRSWRDAIEEEERKKKQKKITCEFFCVETHIASRPRTVKRHCILMQRKHARSTYRVSRERERESGAVFYSRAQVPRRIQSWFLLDTTIVACAYIADFLILQYVEYSAILSLQYVSC